LLSARPSGEIVSADEFLRGLMADSYRDPLWAAAYLVNGGCSDDGFEYFRGWLIMHGGQRHLFHDHGLSQARKAPQAAGKVKIPLRVRYDPVTGFLEPERGT
jgi:Protein of unknown function (DUF4240)